MTTPEERADRVAMALDQRIARAPGWKPPGYRRRAVEAAGQWAFSTEEPSTFVYAERAFGFFSKVLYATAVLENPQGTEAAA